MLWKTFSFASRLIRCFTQSSTQISTGRLQTQTGSIWGYHDNVVLGFQIWGLIRHLCKPQLKLRPVRPTIVGRAKRFLARLRGFYQTVSVKQKIGITQHRYLFCHLGLAIARRSQIQHPNGPSTTCSPCIFQKKIHFIILENVWNLLARP